MMIVLILASLTAGGVAATWKGVNPVNAARLELLGGSLLATGFLLLGAGLRLVVLISHT